MIALGWMDKVTIGAEGIHGTCLLEAMPSFLLLFSFSGESLYKVQKELKLNIRTVFFGNLGKLNIGNFIS